MVLDKFQVRTTGPVDPVTRQPVKVILPFFSPIKVNDNLMLFLYILGSQTGRRNPVWRDGTGCFDRTWHILLASR